MANGFRFKGFMDEVRFGDNGKVVVRDYKSGRPWVGEMKLKHDPQLTIYNAGLCGLLKSDAGIRGALGLEGRLEEFMQGGIFTSQNIEGQFFMIEALSLDPEKVKKVPDAVNAVGMFTLRESAALITWRHFKPEGRLLI